MSALHQRSRHLQLTTYQYPSLYPPPHQPHLLSILTNISKSVTSGENKYIQSAFCDGLPVPTYYGRSTNLISKSFYCMASVNDNDNICEWLMVVWLYMYIFITIVCIWHLQWYIYLWYLKVYHTYLTMCTCIYEIIFSKRVVKFVLFLNWNLVIYVLYIYVLYIKKKTKQSFFFLNILKRSFSSE